MLLLFLFGISNEKSLKPSFDQIMPAFEPLIQGINSLKLNQYNKRK
jgi:hypothetical protein